MFNRQSYRHLHINSKCSKHKKKSERSVRTKVTIPAHTREIHSELRSPLFNVSLNFNESLPHCGIMYVHTERSVRFSFQKFVSQLRIWEQKRTFEMTRSTEISSGNETRICILRHIKYQYFIIYTENSSPDYQPQFQFCRIAFNRYSGGTRFELDGIRFP